LLRRGHTALPWGVAVSAVVFIVSDPICMFFCPPDGRRFLAAGSTVCAAIAVLALSRWPREIVVHLGVVAPSAIVALGRMSFVRDVPTRAARLAISAILALALLLSYLVQR